MKFVLFALSVAMPLTAATAQTAAAGATPAVMAAPVAAPMGIKSNTVVYSSDGRVIGRIDHVRQAAGVQVAASIIHNGSFVEVPVTTLTQNNRSYVTSLTLAQVTRR